MGKKIRKAARNSLMENRARFFTASPKPVLQESVSANNAPANEEISVSKETETCPHLDNGINLKKFYTRIVSVESLNCEDCRKVVGNKPTKKGKNKQGNNEVNGSEAEAIWVCLECSHFSCGGIGLPTIPNSHSAQHAKEYRHPLALQYANPELRWCFPCNALIPVQNFAENGEEKDSLSEFIEILKIHSALSVTRAGRESWFESGSVGRDSWFESGSLRSRLHLANTLPHRLDNTGGYMVRGLMNLGNTCFFNSVLQNLLAIDKLREHLLEVDELVGPLTMSLKNLFRETSPSAGVRYVINPSSLLGFVRMMSPQFKGVQQQDSHELLRFLLNGLSTEESHVTTCSQVGNSTLKPASTFVDNIFGGQISSTVSCLKCGHASVVYEPYLDLSLPLPAKKVPPKTTALVSRSKKQKPPPMMQGRFWPKNKKKYYQYLAKNLTSEPTMEIEENATSSGDSILSESPVLDSAGDINDSALLEGTKHDATNISNSEAAMSVNEIATSVDSALLKGTKHDATNISTSEATMSIKEITTSSGDSALLKGTKHDATNISNSEAAMAIDEIATSSGDSVLLKGTKHDATNISTSEAAMSIKEITTSSGDSALLKGTKHDATNISNSEAAMAIDEIATSSGDSVLLKGTKHDATNISTSEAAMYVDKIAASSFDSALLKETKHDATNISTSETAMSVDEIVTSSVDSALLKETKYDATNISTSEAAMSVDEIATSPGDSVLSEIDVLDSTGHRNGSGLLNGIKHDDTIPISNNHDLDDTLVTHDDTITTHDDTVTMSETHDLAAKNSLLVFNGHDTTTHLGDGDDIVTEHYLVSTVEADMQVDSIDTDETWLANFEEGIFTDEDMLSHNQDSSVIQYFGTSNKVRLAYDTQQEPSDFDVLGCLYDDSRVYAGPTVRYEPSDFDAYRCLYDGPRVYAGPTVSPFSNRFRGSGYMATSYSDSDPDEVNDVDPSLSVEKCLAYFTTPELLKKTENAWHCEQCTKSLLNQKTRLKNETQKPVINGHENENSNASSDSAVEHLLPTGDSNPNDQSTNNGDLALHNEKPDQLTKNGDLALHNGKSDQSTKNGNLALHDGKSDQSTNNDDLALHNGKSDQSTEDGGLALHNVKSDQSTGDGDLTLHNGVSDYSLDIKSCSDNGPADKFENENENGQEMDSRSTEDEKIDSKSVKVVRDASKRILISTAPQVLTIHLKRFNQDARGRLSKINGHVNFEETLDLKPYMDPSCCKDRETYKYRLVGVVEHSGTMRGGHYVAYVKRGAKGESGKDENESSTWYHASDAYVREASLEEVLWCEAYILFYEEM